MDTLAGLGISIVAVGVLATVLVQLYKALASRVKFIPRTYGGATSIVAFLVSVVIMFFLSQAGITADRQEAFANFLLSIVAGFGSWLVSQGTYNGAKKVIESGQ